MDVSMLCLDTYAILEIARNNKNYKKILMQEFVVPSAILAELYYVLYRDTNEETAKYWFKRFRNFNQDVNLDTWIKSARFKYEHRKENLSFFDCIGYIFAKENNLLFVTGDKAFARKKNVLYLK